jgi:hypothetical protein
MTTGSNFPSDTSWVKKEQTKQSDVSRILGKPFSVGSSGGVPTWTYGYYTYNLFGGNYYKELKLYWNQTKALRHYSFSSSFPEDVKLASVVTQPEKPKDLDFE